MPEVAEFAKSFVKLPTIVGSSQKYTGVSDKITDPSYATAIGLMLEDMDVPKSKANNVFDGILGRIVHKAKTIFKGLMP